MKHELRIGNKVNIINRSDKVHLVNPFVFEIVELKAFTVSLILSGTKDYSTPQYIEVKYSDISPIPITEELLVKCGCSPVPSSYEFAKTTDYTHGLFYIDMANQVIKIRGIGEMDFSRIEHLHSFQNIVLDFTNQELTIEI